MIRYVSFHLAFWEHLKWTMLSCNQEETDTRMRVWCSRLDALATYENWVRISVGSSPPRHAERYFLDWVADKYCSDQSINRRLCTLNRPVWYRLSHRRLMEFITDGWNYPLKHCDACSYNMWLTNIVPVSAGVEQLLRGKWNVASTLAFM